MTLAERLQSLMERRHLNAHKLASLTGLGYATVNETVSGKRDNPSVQTLAKLAHALGVRPGILLDEVREEDDGSVRETHAPYQTDSSVTYGGLLADLVCAIRKRSEGFADLALAARIDAEEAAALRQMLSAPLAEEIRAEALSRELVVEDGAGVGPMREGRDQSDVSRSVEPG